MTEELLCSLCSMCFGEYAIMKLGLKPGDPCPDRSTCEEDGPSETAILVRTLEEADAWHAAQDEVP